MGKKLASLISLAGLGIMAAVLLILHANPPSPERLLSLVAGHQLHICFGGTLFILSTCIVITVVLFLPRESLKPAISVSEKVPETEPVQPKPEPVAKIPEPEPETPPPAPKLVDENGIPFTAYQILSLFQKEGRLLDFLMEDISEVDDETLGGGIRPIHEGCKKILTERLVIEPIFSESEGDSITFPDEIDPGMVKLTGNVPGGPPFKGEVVHRGWKMRECHLPELVAGWSGKVVAPGEVEIP